MPRDRRLIWVLPLMNSRLDRIPIITPIRQNSPIMTTDSYCGMLCTLLGSGVIPESGGISALAIRCGHGCAIKKIQLSLILLVMVALPNDQYSGLKDQG